VAKITGLDKAEAGRLREAVRQLENLLAPGNAQGSVASSMLLHQMLEGDKKRLLHLEDLEVAALVEEREKSVKELALSIAAQRETALTAAEREQYAEFLGKEAFSKADFGKLEDFYRSAWNRLSEGGKAQMSTRIWEGVRREEYQFSELPEIVKEKEAQFLRSQLQAQNISPDLQRIPQNDRDDFTNAWDSGKRHEAYEILDRSCFRENVALSAAKVAPESARTSAVTAAPTAEHEAAQPSASKASEPERLDLEVSLGDVKLVTVPNAMALPPQVGTGKTSATKTH
jgi:hypothetical protein